jgi:hypothetical protein
VLAISFCQGRLRPVLCCSWALLRKSAEGLQDDNHATYEKVSPHILWGIHTALYFRIKPMAVLSDFFRRLPLRPFRPSAVIESNRRTYSSDWLDLLGWNKGWRIDMKV